MSLGPVNENKGKVIVVGAGVSGLTSAYRLQQAGFSVRVLEAENRAGGKTCTLQKDGFTLEQGASYMPSTYTSVLEMIDEIGMSNQLHEVGPIGIARGNEIHYLDPAHLLRDGAKTKLLSFKSKLLMLKVLLKSIRINKYLNFEDLSTAAAFDMESAAEYCDRELNDEIKQYIVDATTRGMCASSAETNSVVSFFYANNKLMAAKKIYSLRDGLESYAKKLVELLDDVQLSARVSRVQESANDVRVFWTNETGLTSVEDADACVLAVNGHATSSIFPQLDDWSHQFLKGLRYSTLISVNVALSKPPEGIAAYVILIPKSVHPDLFAMALEHNKAPHAVPAGKGHICIIPMSDWSESLIKEDDNTISEKVIAAAETIIPGFSSDIEFVAIKKWYPVAVMFKPGDYRNLGRFMEQRKKYKRVKLAGDYFSGGSVNTAVTAGQRAAREIVEDFC